MPEEGELGSRELSQPARWILLEGDRRLLAVGLLGVLAFVLGGALWTGAVAVKNADSLTRLFSAFVGGNLTLITVVITINQVILSREFGSPGELRERISNIVAFRHEVEERAEADVSPVTPQAFLEFLAVQIRTHATTIQQESRSIPDAEYRKTVDRYAETLVAQSERIEDALHEQEAGAFNTLLTVLDTDFTSDRYTAERLRVKADDDVPDDVVRTLEDVLSLIDHVGATRQYLMTLYMQQELADLSQKILYTGVPAVTASVLTVWVYGHPMGTTMASPMLEVVVVTAVVVAMSPLAILVAYVLRITTVSRETASLMPFKSQDMRTV